MIDVLGTRDIISFDGRAVEVFELIEGKSKNRYHVARIADVRIEPYDAQSLMLKFWLRNGDGTVLRLPSGWQFPAASLPSAERLVVVVREAATHYAALWGGQLGPR